MTLAEQLRQEGRQEGQVKLLVKQLELKFGELPEEALSKIATASPEELERLGERVLTASSLEEVLR